MYPFIAVHLVVHFIFWLQVTFQLQAAFRRRRN